MNKTNKQDIEDEIREAAERGDVVFASTGEIEQYLEIVHEFLIAVFGINGAFVSDESSCSDFGPSEWRRKTVQIYDIPMPARNALVLDVVKAINLKRMN